MHRLILIYFINQDPNLVSKTWFRVESLQRVLSSGYQYKKIICHLRWQRKTKTESDKEKNLNVIKNK